MYFLISENNIKAIFILITLLTYQFPDPTIETFFFILISGAGLGTLGARR